MFIWDWIDPFAKLGSEAAKIAADAWIAACLSVWWAGLWLLRLVLGWMDAWLTPDLTGNGPGHDLYGTTFWIAGVLVVIMMMIQLGIAVLRGDGKSLGRAVLGVGQFVVIVAGWVGYAVAVTAAAGGLTRASMESMMNVTTWRQWTAFNDAASVGKAVTDGGVATVLMILGLFMWLAAIGHFVLVLARDVALLILVAVGPISAAGLANESTRSWFWKTFRWFHAAVFTPFLVVLVTGIGMKVASGVPTTINGGPEASIGTAVPAVILILVSVVSPLALFKMLAFVDPGTASGAAMRAGLAGMGGLQGLLSGNATADSGAPSGDQADTSSGEASAEAATNTKLANAAGSAAAVFGGVGAAAAAGIGVVMKLGALGASAVTDVTNQAGIGHNTYQPDYQAGPGDGAARANREVNAEPDESQRPASNDPDGTSPMPADTTPTGPGPRGGSGGNPAGGKPGGSGGGGGSGAGGSGAGVSAADAAEVAAVAL